MQLEIFDLGITSYKSAWEIQKGTFGAVKAGNLGSSLIVCRHYPVITLGRSAQKDNILVGEESLRIKGIEMFEAERGGDVTYHGLGQIIVYPIFDLNYFKKDIHWFLRQIEEVVIEFLKEFGVSGQRKSGFTGVWVGQAKISSIGIAIKNWITFHGVSVNIKESDSGNFSLIRPCGLDVKMISLEEILGSNVDINQAKEVLVSKFEGVFVQEELAVA